MSVLGNYIKLEDGVRKRLHFRDHVFVDREIRDPVLGRMKTVRTLTMFVDEEDGVKCDKVLSVVQEKLAAALAPYLPGKRYVNFTFTILRQGTGFRSEFVVGVEPRG